jgi:heme-degrading monooxygenase HmoA
MIIRIYRCTVVAGKEAEHREFAFNKSHPRSRNQPGLVAFYAGRPLAKSDKRTRCMVRIWESAQAIQAAFGDNWDQPPELPEEIRDIYDIANVEHYELADDYGAQRNDRVG